MPVTAARTTPVRRPALVARLAAPGDAALALLVAPAGYGKSTLLAEWDEHDEREFVRLVLDQRDARDVPTLVGSVVRAFEDAGLGSFGAAVQSGARARLARLMRALRAREARFVLVIDDAHVVPDAVLREVVGEIVRQLPRNAMIALGSRREPTLPVGRLRAGRALVEIGMRELAMSTDDAGALLEAAGLELEPESLGSLARRAEGWPAVLYLAALALREQDDIAAAARRFGGGDDGLADYLWDEVLSELSPRLVAFSTRSAVLEELSGPVCDAVLGAEGSAVTLVELSRACPLLRAVDGHHGTYRWHGLCRGALRAELHRAEPALERDLDGRASTWHDRHGDAARAVAHAVSAHDPKRAGDLLWAHGMTLVTQGHQDDVEGWLRSFSHKELAAHAPLALSAAHGLMAAGDVEQAQRVGIAAVAAMERGRPVRDKAVFAAGLEALDAMVAAKGVERMGHAAARAYVLEPRDSPWRPLWLLLRGTARHLTGDSAAGRAMLREGAELGAVLNPSVLSLCLAQDTMIAIGQEDWAQAAELTDRAEHTLARHGLDTYPLSGLVLAGTAATRAHDGRTDEAKRDLRRSIDLLAALGEFVPWYGAEARILLAHASLRLADIVGARTLLADASRLARRTPDAIAFAPWFDNAWAHMDTLAEASLAGPSSLTIAELRVLRFMPSHRSFREIAAHLGVSANTVKAQAHAVYRKLGAASRSEAVARASDAGLLGE